MRITFPPGPARRTMVARNRVSSRLVMEEQSNTLVYSMCSGEHFSRLSIQGVHILRRCSRSSTYNTLPAFHKMLSSFATSLRSHERPTSFPVPSCRPGGTRGYPPFIIQHSTDPTQAEHPVWLQPNRRRPLHWHSRTYLSASNNSNLHHPLHVARRKETHVVRDTVR